MGMNGSALPACLLKGSVRGASLLADDLDEDAVGQGVGAEDVNDPVAGEAAEHCVGFGGGWWGSRSFRARSRSSSGAVGAEIPPAEKRSRMPFPEISTPDNRAWSRTGTL